MKVYEYVIVLNPTPKAGKNGKDNPEKSRILAGPTTILAKSDAEAQFQAARNVPEDYTSRYDELVVAVRPF